MSSVRAHRVRTQPTPVASAAPGSCLAGSTQIQVPVTFSALEGLGPG